MAQVGGKLPFSSYRKWPWRAIILACCPERGGNETPEFHDGSRWRNGGMAARWARAAEGDAGNRLPLELARAMGSVCCRVPPGTERNRLCRGRKCGGRIPLDRVP